MFPPTGGDEPAPQQLPQLELDGDGAGVDGVVEVVEVDVSLVDGGDDDPDDDSDDEVFVVEASFLESVR